MASFQSSFACLLLLVAIASCQVSKMSIDDAGKDEVDDLANWYTFGDKSFVFTDDMQTYFNASDVCKNKYGGHLANLKTEELNKFLTSVLRKTGYDKAWIGLRASYEGWTLVYKWTDGSYATYNRAVPSPWSWSEGCYYMATDMKWYEGGCFPAWMHYTDDVYHYVCQVDGPKPTKAANARPKIDIKARDQIRGV